MKKSTGIIIGVICVIIVLAIVVITNYNSILSMSEEVDGKFANVDTMLQRRADLIPNLVNTVKGYTTQEQEFCYRSKKQACRSKYNRRKGRSKSRNFEYIISIIGSGRKLSRLKIFSKFYPIIG